MSKKFGGKLAVVTGGSTGMSAHCTNNLCQPGTQKDGGLDMLADLKKPTKAALEQAMKGHIIAEAQVIGTYQKGR